MSAAPPLSVLLTCHNPGPRLQTTLASLRTQKRIEPEVILVDRNSSDGTREWIAEQPAPCSSLVLLPEGANVAEAFTQGLGFAHGAWVLMLEAGDRLVGDLVLSETWNWTKKTEAGVVAGEAAGDDGRLHKLRSRVNPLAGDFTPRAATFYRRSLFEENGAFAPEFGAMATYEFHLRLWKNRVRFKPIPLRIAACEPSPRFDWEACRHEIRARHRYFGAGRCLAWDALSLLRCLRPRARRAS